MIQTLTLAVWHSCGLGEVEYARDYYYLNGMCIGNGPMYYTGRYR